MPYAQIHNLTKIGPKRIRTVGQLRDAIKDLPRSMKICDPVSLETGVGTGWGEDSVSQKRKPNVLTIEDAEMADD